MFAPIRRTFIFCLTLITAAWAQKPAAPAGLRYVMPNGNGAIMIPLDSAWKPELLNLLDGGTRIAIQLKNEAQSLDASYILFPNRTGAPTSESCREAVIGPVVNSIKTNATVIDQHNSTRTIADGQTLAVASYMIAKAGSVPLQQQNVFGFFGDAHTCAEIHVSKVNFSPADKPQMEAALNAFSFDPSYTPTPPDYGLLGTLFYNYFQDYPSAAIYYQRALDTLPASAITGPNASVLGRVTVDQLSMSYGLSGDLARSRAINEAAIARDPTYPMYYYNLACADAESGDAVAAETHLRQAFARRDNAIKGEPFPDPTQDSSILKLKNNTAFWAFIQSLPKN